MSDKEKGKETWMDKDYGTKTPTKKKHKRGKTPTKKEHEWLKKYGFKRDEGRYDQGPIELKIKRETYYQKQRRKERERKQKYEKMRIDPDYYRRRRMQKYGLKRAEANIIEDKNALLQYNLEDRNQVDTGMRDELTNQIMSNLTGVLGPLNTTLRQPNILYPKDYVYHWKEKTNRDYGWNLEKLAEHTKLDLIGDRTVHSNPLNEREPLFDKAFPRWAGHIQSKFINFIIFF